MKVRGIVPIGSLLILALACGGAPPAPGRPVVVTLVPAGAESANGPSPAERYPDGSRLVLADLDHPESEPRVLSAGLTAAGGAGVSTDARQIVFVGKESPGDPFSVWTAAVDGSDRRQVAAPGADCGAAAFLPDGRIVFSARLPGAGEAAPWALYVTSPEAAEPQRITFGGSELDPAVLADGRIVHAHWQPGGDGRPEPGSYSLFTVHPDGTGDAPLSGHHGGPRLKLLPRQAPNGDVFFLASDGPEAEPALAAAGWRSPAEDGFTVPLIAASPRAAEPTSDGRLLVAAGRAGLLVIDRRGEVQSTWLAGDSSWEVVHGVEVAPRPRPQGQLSMVDPEGDRGQLLCLDARPPDHPEASRVRLRAASADGSPAGVLGEVELAADGSFFATVPADLPLLLEVLDRHGDTVETTSTPVWVRPKEVRGCIGCHEEPETAPPNARPAAVLADPVDLTGGGALAPEAAG